MKTHQRHATVAVVQCTVDFNHEREIVQRGESNVLDVGK